MNKKIYITGISLAMLSLASCSDFLDREPIDFGSEVAFYVSETDLQMATNEFYDNILPKNETWVGGIYDEDNTSDNQIGTAPDNLFYEGEKRTVEQSVSEWNFDNLRGINYFINRVNFQLNGGGGITGSEEYINHSRPLPEWEKDTPEEILSQLNQEPKPKWVHWFFSFHHNAGLSTEKKAQIIQNVPKGTKLYKNKILGLRGRSTGLVFNLESKSIITGDEARKYGYLQFSAGVDTSYSQSSPDTFSFAFSGITEDRKKITLAVEQYNNRDRKTPITPSDVPGLLTQFLERNRQLWGFARHVYIDSADQATILECQKYARQSGSIYSFNPAWKKTKIIDRINMQAGWMAHGDYLLVGQECKPLIDELGLYSWKEDKDNEPEDGHDHCINADQYSWLPYKDKIGSVRA